VPRVFSGIQPTGDLHLGNYLGALINWVRMQDTHDCVFCVVDMHAVTLDYDRDGLAGRTVEMATNLLAVGVDPARSILFAQSHVGDVHGEATWLLNCSTRFGELNKQPQWKEKGLGKDSASMGLFDYPVLQAADILLYHADEVPVGEDQRHHVELTRNIAHRFNSRFAAPDAPIFTLPTAIHPKEAARVMDLQNPTAKMSKSADSPKGTVLVLDDPAKVAKKIRAAVTDSETEVRHDRHSKPGVANLLEMMSVATGRTIDDLVGDYATTGYGRFKGDVAEAVVEMLRPARERHAALSADPGEVARILREGATRARAICEPTRDLAKAAMGFLTA